MTGEELAAAGFMQVFTDAVTCICVVQGVFDLGKPVMSKTLDLVKSLFRGDQRDIVGLVVQPQQNNDAAKCSNQFAYHNENCVLRISESSLTA